MLEFSIVYWVSILPYLPYNIFEENAYLFPPPPMSNRFFLPLVIKSIQYPWNKPPSFPINEHLHRIPLWLEKSF